jgi:hypothetical protein
MAGLQATSQPVSPMSNRRNKPDISRNGPLLERGNLAELYLISLADKSRLAAASSNIHRSGPFSSSPSGETLNSELHHIVLEFKD